jgi:two-component system cell cycle response regulator
MNAPKPRTVLIVDDSEAIQSHLRRVLSAQNEPLELLVAPDGLAAYGLLLRHKIDLVLCDLIMPGIDGFKFLALKRGRPELVDIPVIMLAGASEVAEKVKALEAGAADYLSKPFHDQELVARLRVHLRLRALQDELKEKNEQLVLLSRTDALTGVWNRRYLLEMADIELARAQRYGTPLGCIILDLDHFKSINDRFGHTMGDQVLVAVARMLQRDLRKCDMAARYGGEEFVVLLPQTGLEGAQTVAERERASIGSLAVSFGDAVVHPTASFGVTAIPACRAGTFADLVGKADAALYRAKEKGRNRVETLTPETEPTSSGSPAGPVPT